MNEERDAVPGLDMFSFTVNHILNPLQVIRRTNFCEDIRDVEAKVEFAIES